MGVAGGRGGGSKDVELFFVFLIFVSVNKLNYRFFPFAIVFHLPHVGIGEVAKLGLAIVILPGIVYSDQQMVLWTESFHPTCHLRTLLLEMQGIDLGKLCKQNRVLNH